MDPIRSLDMLLWIRSNIKFVLKFVELMSSIGSNREDAATQRLHRASPLHRQVFKPITNSGACAESADRAADY